MSCNGCRVLRKGCSETCVLRSCLRWINSSEAQGHATLFLAKFFGRSDLMSLISSVPDSQRSALFQSLLFEACGRTINPVNGAVGLLWSGNWHVCQAAVETVLSGGFVQPLPSLFSGGKTKNFHDSSDSFSTVTRDVGNIRIQSKAQTSGAPGFGGKLKRARDTVSVMTEESGTSRFESYGGDRKKLLNLFV